MNPNHILIIFYLLDLGSPLTSINHNELFKYHSSPSLMPKFHYSILQEPTVPNKCHLIDMHISQNKMVDTQHELSNIVSEQGVSSPQRNNECLLIMT